MIKYKTNQKIAHKQSFHNDFIFILSLYRYVIPPIIIILKWQTKCKFVWNMEPVALGMK